MNKTLFAYVGAVLFLWVQLGHAASESVGQQAAPQMLPERIITLAPHLTELVFAAGAGGKLVGVSAYSDYPAEAKRLPVIASSGKINVEAVLKLKPDLVLAWRGGMQASEWEKLEQQGIRVLETETESLEDVPRILRFFGLMFGNVDIAESEALKYEQNMADLKRRYGGRREVKTFIEIWPAPLMTVNGQHLISKVVSLCRGKNIFSNLNILTPTVSVERLYSNQPTIILSSVSSATTSQRWRAFPRLAAVRGGQFYVIDASLLTRMSPRLPQAAAQICELIDVARKLEAP